MGVGSALLMFGFLGSLLSAGSNLLGGILGNSNSQSIEQQNIAQQRDFAQNALTWRAQDATNAQTQTGINRLALLGTPTNSFSNIVGDNSLGAGVGAAGQDIGRAVGALAPDVIRRSELENKLLEAKIANVNADTIHQQATSSALVKAAQPGTPPSLYTDYVDDRGIHHTLPSTKASSSMQNWASLPAQIPIAFDLGRRSFDNAVANYHLPDFRGDIARAYNGYWGAADRVPIPEYTPQ